MTHSRAAENSTCITEPRIDFWRSKRFAVAALVSCLCAGFSASVALAQQSGPVIRVDLASLPAEVLNCNVCRMRLGLQPIPGGGTTDFAEHDRQAALSQVQPASASLPSTPNAPSKTVEPAAEPQPAEPVNSAESVTAEVQEPSPESYETNPAPADTLLAPKRDVTPATPAESSENRLSQFSSSAEAQQSVAPIADNSYSAPTVEGDYRFRSPTAVQIELELAKKQLAERNALIEKFNQNQANLETQISQLSLTNRQLQAALQARSDSAEKATSQLQKVATESSEKMSQLQRELDNTKRELSVATGKLKLQGQELEVATRSELESLRTKLTDGEAALQKAVAELESMRRQRDGFERELATVQESLRKDENLEGPVDASDDRTARLIAAAREKIAKLNESNAALTKELEAFRQRGTTSTTTVQGVSMEQFGEMRTQLEQQAAIFMEAQTKWDAERASLLSELAKAKSDAKPTDVSRNAEAVVQENAEMKEAATTPAPDASSEDEPTAATTVTGNEASKEATSESGSEASKPEATAPVAGPKKPSRAPRKTDEDIQERRDF